MQPSRDYLLTLRLLKTMLDFVQSIAQHFSFHIACVRFFVYAESVAVQKTPTPRSAPSKGEHGLVVIHWNVAGLNGLLKSPERRKLLISLIAAESPHVLALSEHKISEEKLHAAEAELKQLVLGKYTVHWAICTAKKGYSGMLMLIRKGVAVQSIKMNEVCSDLNEGRTVTAELDAVYVVAT
eukprot:6204197-Pleurochrysis_carterae.AAC.4